MVDGGGWEGGAPWVVGTVVTERESEDGDRRRVKGRRNRRCRLHEVQSMVEGWRSAGGALATGGQSRQLRAISRGVFMHLRRCLWCRRRCSASNVMTRSSSE